MTEAEWLTCADVKLLVRHLVWDRKLDGRPRARKLRLFACACCRRVLHLVPDEGCRSALEVSERYADRLATEKAREEANKAVNDFFWKMQPRQGMRHEAVNAIRWATVKAGAMSAAEGLARYAADHAANAELMEGLARDDGPEASPGKLSLSAIAPAWLRDLFGNPFCAKAALSSAIHDWQGGEVRRLAQGIYESGRFEGLLVLADALEEAGCTDEEMLGHCRSPGSHLRGCWAVDHILGLT
jgi:hypothetical protein